MVNEYNPMQCVFGPEISAFPKFPNDFKNYFVCKGVDILSNSSLLQTSLKWPVTTTKVYKLEKRALNKF